MRLFKYAIVISTVAIIIASCSSNQKEKQLKAIDKLEQELYADQSLNREKGLHMIDTYVNYSKQFPADTISAHFLFKAGEVAMNLQLGSQSIYYYDKLLSNYPDFKKAPECVFLKAFIYENQMSDLKMAEEFYSKFLELYPNHPLAKDAEASLKYLGKSPEELVKMFQEMNQQ